MRWTKGEVNCIWTVRLHSGAVSISFVFGSATLSFADRLLINISVHGVTSRGAYCLLSIADQYREKTQRETGAWNKRVSSSAFSTTLKTHLSNVLPTRSRVASQCFCFMDDAPAFWLYSALSPSLSLSLCVLLSLPLAETVVNSPHAGLSFLWGLIPSHLCCSPYPVSTLCPRPNHSV